MDKNYFQYVLDLVPTRHPYRFIENILALSDEGITASHTFQENETFYAGHFPGRPVTPGALLLETMAQIGLIAFGIHLLLSKNQSIAGLEYFFSSSEIDFIKPVYPGHKVIVEASKIYFRFGKLKCKVVMHDQNRNMLCRGTVSGLIKTNRKQK